MVSRFVDLVDPWRRGGSHELPGPFPLRLRPTLSLLLLLAVPLGAAARMLSVGIGLSRTEAEVAGSHGVRLLDPASGEVLGSSWGKAPVTLTWDPGARALASKDLARGPAPAVLVRPVLRGRVVFQGHEYRGQLLLREDPQGGFNVINLVDLEDYLLGVLPREMSPSAPSEALKAQAVASRTYALRHAADFQARGFGLKASEGSQVYAGVEVEDPRTTRAVQSTRGKVLRHGHDLVHAWFSASCGGMTTANEDVWGGDAQPYARPVPCGFCTIFPGYHWQAEVPHGTLAARLREVGKGVGEVRGVRFSRRQGRVVRAVIQGSERLLELTGNEFRILAGHRTVRSLRFVPHDDPVGDALQGHAAARQGVSDEELIRRIIGGEARVAAGQALHLEGTGYGHGVGLCQWGARGLAEQGHGFERILTRYYRGARVVASADPVRDLTLGAASEPVLSPGL